MSRPARSARRSVSAPRPGPISRTVSSPSRWSASAMRPRIRRSVRKCWPRLLRVGGKAARRDFAPSSDAIRSALQNDEREIVARRRVAGVVVEQPEYRRRDLRGLLVAMTQHAVEHRLLAKSDPFAVARIRDAVGEEHEQVAADVPLPRLGARGLVGHAERWSTRGEAFDLTDTRDDEGVRVAGVAVAEDPLFTIHDGVERGDEHL